MQLTLECYVKWNFIFFVVLFERARVTSREVPRGVCCAAENMIPINRWQNSFSLHFFLTSFSCFGKLQITAKNFLFLFSCLFDLFSFKFTCDNQQFFFVHPRDHRIKNSKSKFFLKETLELKVADRKSFALKRKREK